MSTGKFLFHSPPSLSFPLIAPFRALICSLTIPLPLNSELFTLPSSLHVPLCPPSSIPSHRYRFMLSQLSIPSISLHPIPLSLNPLAAFAVCCIAVSPLSVHFSFQLSIWFFLSHFPYRVSLAALTYLIMKNLVTAPFLYQSRLFIFHTTSPGHTLSFALPPSLHSLGFHLPLSPSSCHSLLSLLKAFFRFA